MNKLRSHFTYDHRKRSGIIALSLLILLSLSWYFIDYSSQPIEVNLELEKQLLAIQTQLDSTRLANEDKQYKIYPFNPNYISDYKGYTLGMKVEEIDRLRRFRENGKWINSISDFKQVTQVSDSLLAIISPYFKFPEWVTNQTKKKANYPIKKTLNQKKELNTITIDQLSGYDGITEELAIKIINERNRIGGFLLSEQLYDIWGVPKKSVRVILNDYAVKNKPLIEKIDLNLASASQLATIKYINFDLAKEIIDYRILHEGIKTVDDIAYLDGMTDYKLNRIKLYVFVNLK